MKISDRGTTTSEAARVLGLRSGVRARVSSSASTCDGFADAHVVGQAAAEAESLQELHPAEALALIMPQFAGEAPAVGEQAPGKIPKLLTKRGKRCIH